MTKFIRHVLKVLLQCWPVEESHARTTACVSSSSSRSTVSTTRSAQLSKALALMRSIGSYFPHKCSPPARHPSRRAAARHRAVPSCGLAAPHVAVVAEDAEGDSGRRPILGGQAHHEAREVQVDHGPPPVLEAASKKRRILEMEREMVDTRHLKSA